MGGGERGKYKHFSQLEGGGEGGILHVYDENETAEKTLLNRLSLSLFSSPFACVEVDFRPEKHVPPLFPPLSTSFPSLFVLPLLSMS